MAARRTARHGSGGLTTALLVVGVIFLTSLTGVGLWAAGVFQSAPAPVSREGQIACPALARDVPTYAKVTREDLLNPQNGQLNIVWLPKSAEGKALRDVSQIMGRVVSRDKSVGSVLSEADFFPKGTRPGITAGAPPGSVVLTVPAGRIEGLELLHDGDRFTLQAQLADAIRPAFPKLEWATVQGGRLAPEHEVTQGELRSGIRTVVDLAVVIRSADAARLNKTKAAGTNRRRSDGGDQIGEVISIAVPAEQAVAVLQMLKRDDPLLAVGHSSQPDDRPGPESVPLDSVSTRPPNRVSDSTIHLAGWRPGNGVRVIPAQVAGGAAAMPDGVDGWIPVPVTARDVKPFERLKVEDFVDPATGRLRVFYFPPDKFDETWVTDLADVLDRVISEPLDSGRVVRQSLLLPEGTRPGVSAGIPPGWAAIQLTSLQVRGLAMANELDHIELVAARPIRAEHAQAKAEWPYLRSDAVFTVPDSVDVFTQADIRLLATDAIVLTRAVEEVEVAVVDEEETAQDESEVGDSVSRKSIVRKKTPRYVTRSAVVCSVAVPAEVVTALTEALAIQSIAVGGGDAGGANADAGTDAGSDGQSNDEAGTGQRLDNEVAIFAVIRSSNPDAAVDGDQVPGRDVIEDWLREWSSRFVQHQTTQRTAPPAAIRVQRISGATIEDQYRASGRDVSPQQAAGLQRDRVTEEVLRNEAQ